MFYTGFFDFLILRDGLLGPNRLMNFLASGFFSLEPCSRFDSNMGSAVPTPVTGPLDDSLSSLFFSWDCREISLLF